MPSSISRFIKGWRDLGPREKSRAGAMLLTIAALNAAGWGLFAFATRLRFSGGWEVAFEPCALPAWAYPIVSAPRPYLRGRLES